MRGILAILNRSIVGSVGNKTTTVGCVGMV